MGTSLKQSVSDWLNSIDLQDDPEWTMMARLLMASAESLDDNYQPSTASEFRKLSAHMSAYSETTGTDALDAILKRAV